jgi:putative FmdB family regulatory protein
MPLYDYECATCKRDFEAVRRIADRKVAPCPACGNQGRIIPPHGRGPGIISFREGWYRDIDYNPIYIKTPQELRNECDKRHVYSHYLENSTFRTSPGPDPDRESCPEQFGGYYRDGVGDVQEEIEKA